MDNLIQDLYWLEKPPKNFQTLCNNLINKKNNKDFLRVIENLSKKNLDCSQLNTLSEILINNTYKISKNKNIFRLGVLGGHVTDLFLQALPAVAMRHGLYIDIVSSDYDNIVQEVLDKNSNFNKHKYDAVLLSIDYRNLFFEKNRSLDRSTELIKTIKKAVSKNLNCPIIFQNISCPPIQLHGSYDKLNKNSLRKQIEDFNFFLYNFIQNNGDYLFDVSALSEIIGTQNWFDFKYWALAKVPFSPNFIPIYLEFLSRILRAIKGLSKKCLVLDLDNTIWGGVIGDDGLDGIKLGQGDSISETFLEFQKTIIKLKETGVILAVCSKNNEDIARLPFKKHKDMIIKEEDISAFYANWDDKALNIQKIAKNLNIGLDSIVFFDDNPVEREFIRQNLPEVSVPELPNEDPVLYSQTLLHAGYFETVSLSSEDKNRSHLYKNNSRRLELKNKIESIDDYLEELDMTIEIDNFNDSSLTRVTQLINKTNQFNLTAKRYTFQQVKDLSINKNFLTIQARVTDRFGDNGIIAILIAELKNNSFNIDTWLMSCRVLSRKIEDVLFDELTAYAKKKKIKTIEGMYVKTEKNSLVKDHYQKFGFNLVEQKNSISKWILELKTYKKIKKLPFKKKLLYK
jgi:FkbH-like protein